MQEVMASRKHFAPMQARGAKSALENVPSGAKNPESSLISQGQQVCKWTVENKDSSKLDELCGNVTENKGPLWKTGGKAGML